MDSGAGAGGREDSGVERKGFKRQEEEAYALVDERTVRRRRLVRQSSSATSLNASGTLKSLFEVLNLSRVNALRATVKRHSDTISKLLLLCKESLERHTTIESAFWACRDALMEVSAVFTYTAVELANKITIS